VSLLLAGVEIRPELVEWIRQLGPRAHRIPVERGSGRRPFRCQPRLDDRRGIFEALDDPPDEFANLRGVLVRDLGNYRRIGLA
jgi:hypothetical protein